MEALKISKDKRGFATVMAIVGGVVSLVFLLVFSFVFITQLTGNANLLDPLSPGGSAINNLTRNLSSGVNQVSNNLVPIFSIAVFVLLVTILLIAYVLARRNGLIGNATIG